MSERVGMKKYKLRENNIPGQRTSRKKSLQLPIRKPMQNQKIAPFQPQLEENESQRVNAGWQRLSAQAQRINQIAAELETAIYELKAIANDLNCDRRILNRTQTKSVCEYFTASVPWVRRKKTGVLVLTTRRIDLFRAEREATHLANMLRNLAKKRKKVVSLPTQPKLRVQPCLK